VFNCGREHGERPGLRQCAEMRGRTINSFRGILFMTKLLKNRLILLLKEPLLQFLLIGAAIYGAYALYGPPQGDMDARKVIVDNNRIETIISQWNGRWKRPPTRQELDGIINAYVREEILYRKAVEIGLNEDDPITRRRLAQKLEFLTKNIALLRKPEESELEQYFADNIDLFRAPVLITFSHAFLDPDVRDKTTLEDAEKLLENLQAEGEPDVNSPTLGDRFMLENRYTQVSELDIRRSFGGGFADSVMQLDAGKWHGPVLSGFGVHLVYVHEIIDTPAPKFADVRKKVLASWQEKQQSEFNRDFYENLKASYEVVIADVPEDRILNIPAGAKDKTKSKPSTEPSQ
jgi:peptidyl-prolyl cis-trans isomerase C